MTQLNVVDTQSLGSAVAPSDDKLRLIRLAADDGVAGTQIECSSYQQVIIDRDYAGKVEGQHVFHLTHVVIRLKLCAVSRFGDAENDSVVHRGGLSCQGVAADYLPVLRGAPIVICPLSIPH
jgi:hypothetical protein